MKKGIKRLNSKEKKRIYQILVDKYNYSKDLSEYTFFINTKNRLSIINTETLDLVPENVRVDSLGMYFGELFDEEIRLTIDGSQLIGPFASKNICEISREQLALWIRGESLEVECDGEGFHIVKCENDYIACGKLKHNKLTNFVPKTRRISAKLHDPTCNAKV